LLDGFCSVAFFFFPFFLLAFPLLFVCFMLQQADKHTRKETTKITKENSTGTKHKWKHAESDHVKKQQKKKSSEAESFKHMKINI
jgi:hypothetical protein